MIVPEMDMEAILLVSGLLIGIFSVVIGGGFFFSVPLLQLLFPHASVGVIVGNLKVASLVRGVSTAWVTRHSIAWRDTLICSIPLVIGSFFGATLIADLSQRWILPVLLLAVLVTERAAYLSKYFSVSKLYWAFFLLGIYTGFLGAGTGLLIVTLLRLRHPEDGEIAWIKIQTRLIELVAVVSAVIAHLLHGNLVMDIWLYYSIGAFVGGMVGGAILERLEKLSGRVQHIVLRIAFLFGIAVSSKAFILGFF